jgi:hypothetical protein
MNALYILLGWVLGLFSPRIIDIIQKPNRRKKIRESLFIELEELSRKLSANTYLIYDQRGMIDRAFLNWIKPIMGPVKRRHAELSFGEKFDKTLTLTDEQIQSLFQGEKDKRKHYTLKKSDVPFLDLQIINLSLFTPEFQRLVMRIRSQVRAINEEIDKAWFNYTKTFDSGLSTNNHALVQANMHEANMNAAQMCRDVCDDITEILERKK